MVSSDDSDDVPFEIQPLWSNKGIKKSHKLLTIIFVHGLQLRDGKDAWKATWTRRGTKVCWPEAWLPQDLGKKDVRKEDVRVLSASYAHAASHWGKKQQKMQQLQKFGSSLLEKLINYEAGEWLHDSGKIVLVGHSFGGLIIKALFIQASKHALNDDDSEFLKYTKEIIFYAVPHSGKLIAEYVTNFNKAFPHRLAGTLSTLSALEAEMEELSTAFKNKIQQLSKDQYHAPHGIKIFSFVEQLEYNKVLVLPWDLETELIGNNMVLNANHVDICKPSARGDPGYQKLLGILSDLIQRQYSNDHMSISAINPSTSKKDSKSSMFVSRVWDFTTRMLSLNG